MSSSADEHKENIQHLQSILNTQDTQLCMNLLKANDWQLEQAVTNALALNEQELQANYGQQSSAIHNSSSNLNNTLPVSTSSSSSSSSSFMSAPLFSSRQNSSRRVQTQNNSSSSNSDSSSSFPGVSLFRGLFSFVGRFFSAIFPWTTETSSSSSSSSLSALQENEHFITEFNRQYSNNSPPFFHGTYSEAVRHAANVEKFLFVYLHSSVHDDTAEFCTRTLCTESMNNFLTENMISWAGSIRHSEAYRVSHRLEATAFPFIAVLAPSGDHTAVIYRHSGLIDIDEVIPQLLLRMEAHRSAPPVPVQSSIVPQPSITPPPSEQQQHPFVSGFAQSFFGSSLQHVPSSSSNTSNNVVSSDAAVARSIREFQDEEYAEALERDREEQEKREKELEQERKIYQERKQAEQKAKKRAEDQQKKKEQIIELRQSELLLLGDEPSPASDVSTISIRLTDGKKIQRRFYESSVMKDVFTLIDAEEMSNDDAEGNHPKYQIVSNFPRIIHSDPSATIASLKLGKQILLYVEIIDSE